MMIIDLLDVQMLLREDLGAYSCSSLLRARVFNGIVPRLELFLNEMGDNF